MPEIEKTQQKNGWLFPQEAHIPEQSWYEIDFGSTTVQDLDREGHVNIARQFGVQSMQTTVSHTGTDDNGIMYAVCETVIEFEDGDVYSAVGGADTASNQVRDPEHVWSVAGSRSVKRAVKRALGIRSMEDSTTSDHEATASDPTDAPKNAPDGIQEPPSQWDGDDDMEW